MIVTATKTVGRSFDNLIAEVERQKNDCKDYIAPAARVGMTDRATFTMAAGPNRATEDGMIGTDLAHDQVAEYLDIPRGFYSRIRGSHPDLLASNVNRLMGERKTEKRLVRTLDNKVRAFLSDSYRPLDNYDLMKHLLPVLADRKDLTFREADITERRLYIKMVSNELVGDVAVGDTIRMGLIISNSEVGKGALLVAPFTDRLVCKNGMVHTNLGTKKHHIGRAMGGDDDAAVRRFYSAETNRLDDRAFFSKIRDTVAGVLSGDVLRSLLAQLREAGQDDMGIADPMEIVEVAKRGFSLSDAEGESTLRNLITGADLSRFGLAQAITATARELDQMDRRTELETLGGQIIAKPIKVITKRRAVSIKGQTGDDILSN